MAALKSIRFTEKDKALIEKIEAYRKERRLPTFIEAVRVLCSDALEFKKIAK